MADDCVYRLGELFKNRKEKGHSGLPFLSVTLNDGLVDRNSLDRKFETNIAPEEHLFVRKGDIAYNMMRMWQGAFGLAKNDGLVSPAYVVLEPRNIIDSKYAAHLFKSPRLIHLFWAYSYGLTDDRLRLYFQDFARIRVSIPSVRRQQTIGAMLTTWDEAITTLDKIIENHRVRNQGLMQQILTKKKRGNEANDWKNLRLGKLFVERKEVGHLKLPLLSVTREAGVISQHELDINESSNENKSKYLRVCPGDIAYNTMRMWQGISGISEMEGIVSPAYTVVTPRAGVSGRFMAHLFKNPRTVHDFRRYSQGLVSDTWNLKFHHFKEILVQVPELAVQERIADALDAANKEVSLLVESRRLLISQKAALMQRLLITTVEEKLEPIKKSAFK